MSDRMTFEDRLAAAFERYVQDAPRDVDPYVVARTALAAGGHGRLDRLGRIFDSPVMRVAAAVVVLLLALVAAVIVGSALQREPPLPIVHGEFTLVGPPEQQDTRQAVLLDDMRVLVFGTGNDPTTGVDFGFIDVFDPATGDVTRLGEGRVERRWHPQGIVRLADGRVLVTGGREIGNENLLPTELIDPDTSEITAVGQLVVPRTDHTATLLADGRVLIAGGGNARRNGDLPTEGDPPAELFDPSTGSFRVIGRPHHNRAYHRATLLADGRVLITGGSGAGRVSAAEIFDPATESFQVVDGMREWIDHSATLLDDGRVLLVGSERVEADGLIPADPVTRADLFDPGTSSFSEAGTLTTERSQHAAVLLSDGRVLIAGGYNDAGNPRTTELFDPATGSFLRGADTLDRLGPTNAVALPDGQVLVVGERHRFEAFDPGPVGRATPIPGPRADLAGTVKPVKPPTVERRGHTAKLLRDGKVLVVGGWADGVDPQQPTDTAELYDPQIDQWSATGSLGERRAFHNATLLADGRVLVVGGQVLEQEPDGGWTYAALDRAEVFDPAAGAFTPVGPMTLARSGSGGCCPQVEHFSSTVLPDGRVLISGGTDKPGLDLFDPRTNMFTAIPASCQGNSVLLPEGRVLIGCGPGLTFDPTTDQVTSTGMASLDELGTRLADGRMLFMDAIGSNPLVRHPEFNPAEPFAWAAMTGFNEVLWDRYGVGTNVDTITPLPDGRSLIVAHRDDENTHPLRVGLAAVFDPNLTTFTEVTSPAGRIANTATMLQDGRILFVGRPVRSPDRTDPEPPGAELLDLGLGR